MTNEAAFVFALIGISAVLMASNKVRYDVVSLLVVLALMLSGTLTVAESVAGFGSPVVILVAGLLVVGEMLARTGVATAVGDWILNKGGSNEAMLLVLIMASAGLLGAVMSSTAIVAIFIPIVMRIAADTGINASRMLLPMSYAALISGMLTLIATTPNIVVHEELKAEGFDGFGFFGFTAIGLSIMIVAIAYIVLFGRHLLPGNAPLKSITNTSPSLAKLWDSYRTGEDRQYYRVGKQSSLIGAPVSSTEIFNHHDIQLIGMARGDQVENHIAAIGSEWIIAEGDSLLLFGRPDSLESVAKEQGLHAIERNAHERKRWLREIGGATVLIHPDSALLGKTIHEANFSATYGVNLLGLRRATEPVAEYADTRLQAADSLFLIGSWQRIQQLRNMAHDFVVLETPSEIADAGTSFRRMPVALAILLAMVVLSVFNIVPLLAAVIMAALAAILTRCLTMEDAYRAIHWSSLVLIAGMLPLADALYATGGTQLIVDMLLSAVGDAGPYTMLSTIFFLTAGLSLVLSNTAAAVLVAPIAIYMATSVGFSPYPFAVAVVIAASAAYSTPVSSPVVTLVVDPGRYRFTDFVKVGVPLLILSYLVTMIITPLIFPFN